MQQHKFFGVSVLVKQLGNVVYTQHFEVASADTKISVNDDTIFRLASMTKPITAVAVMCLYDMGLLDLDDLVEKYIPEYNALWTAKVDKGEIVLGDQVVYT